ncbi:MAG: YdcF family protein [bacterium]|nr:YdcF family protein [bacterium]
MIVQILMILTGLYLTVNSCIMAVYSNFTIGIITELALGLLLFMWGVFYSHIKMYTDKGVKRIIKIIIACGIAAAFAVCAFFGLYGVNDSVGYNEDAVIVLGCAVRGTEPTQPLAARLDAAVKYHEKNPDAYIIVSGGQGPQEYITEAECMKAYLIAHGVNESVILTEDRAASTTENIRYSREIMKEKGIPETDIAMITNEFHIFRARQLARLNGLEVTTLHAKTPWYSSPMMYLREIFAVGQLILLGK